MKLKCNSSVTKQEVYKNEKNEQETAAKTDVAVAISQIFKGAVKADKIKDRIQGKNPDEMIALAHYC